MIPRERNTMVPEFKAFDKIPRFKRNYVITEKIDGTNAAVGVLEDGTVYAQSRTRLITPESDNFGFARWVKQYEDELRHGLGEGLHFGEWWGSGIQRNYGLTNGNRVFSLFNTGRWTMDDPPPKCCSVVPVLCNGNDDLDNDIHMCLCDLAVNGSVAAPGFMKPEGVVVYHSASRGYFKILLENDEIPKGVPYVRWA